jgi:ADP-ribose pyrophosphatase YjhB (NUDIX family)
VNVVVLRIADRARRLVWRLAGPRMVGVRAIVVHPDDGKVLLVRHSYGREAWYLPGGGVKRRETIEQAVRREVREEVAVDITGPVRLLGTYSNLREGKSDHISVFVVEHWQPVAGQDAAADAEIAEARFVDPFPHGLPEATSAGTRRRLDEWHKGDVSTFEW